VAPALACRGLIRARSPRRSAASCGRWPRHATAAEPSPVVSPRGHRRAAAGGELAARQLTPDLGRLPKSICERSVTSPLRHELTQFSKSRRRLEIPDRISRSAASPQIVRNLCATIQNLSCASFVLCAGTRCPGFLDLKSSVKNSYVGNRQTAGARAHPDPEAVIFTRRRRG
jgi:hypothetical protein